MTRVRARDRARHGIGYVPEGRHVFPGLSVEKNLLLGSYARRRDEETRAALDEVHELFPVLREMSGRLAGALSGGRQQTLAIGRALMARPHVLLLDEPSTGLSPELVGFILDALQRLREEGLSLLLVEQNAKPTFGATSHCLVLENGGVAMTGSSEELSRDTSPANPLGTVNGHAATAQDSYRIGLTGSGTGASFSPRAQPARPRSPELACRCTPRNATRAYWPAIARPTRP
ncbi:ABC transporter ATP-binding protein [Streptomyces sp. NPDC058469]|uniref:ABC transporter ATP-binding protein n=1 Tax=Streptomyces sp. NPDC058469 TaxID=3346514 RepID=UPI00365EF2E9